MSGDARHILEHDIFAAIYADPAVHTILFVGVGPYTSWYPALFRTRPNLDFATVDADPQVARWGARGGHRIARLETLADESEHRCAYDLVIANGLFGFGTDSDQANASVVDACHGVLTPGGRLLVGYSEPGTFDPRLVDRARFRPAMVPGLPTELYVTANANRHAFACFMKLEPDEPAPTTGHTA